MRLFLLLATTAAVPAWAQTTPAPSSTPANIATPATAAPPVQDTTLADPAAAQTPPAVPPAGSPSDAAAATAEAQGEAGEGEEIVVTGRKPVGSVVGDIPPEQTLSPADIRSYGVS